MGVFSVSTAPLARQGARLVVTCSDVITCLMFHWTAIWMEHGATFPVRLFLQVLVGSLCL